MLEREEMLSQVTDPEEGILYLFSLSAVHVNLYNPGQELSLPTLVCLSFSV